MADKTQLDMMVEDLKASGLTFQDMMCRVMDNPERNALGVSSTAVQGYIIPYFDMYGRAIKFYRAKIFKMEPKYRQAKGSPNHVYFPPNFKKAFAATKGKMLVLTEGEKKAAIACKLGIPAVAFGGVDSWVNRTILVPKEAEVSSYTHNRMLHAVKLPSANFDESMMSTNAIGFQEMIDVCLKYKTTFYIIYDSEPNGKLSSQAQRAAAKLGYELRFKGFPIDQIRQIMLPGLEDDDDFDGDKIGLDDYLMSDEGGIEGFGQLLKECKLKASAFPRHPNVREHINKKLQKPKLDRKETQNISLAIITELDSRGKRMYSKAQGQMFFFDTVGKSLMKVEVNAGDLQAMQETPFGRLLYRDFGISPAADDRIIKWFGAQFAAEDPVEDVDPKRIIAQPAPGEDIIRYQINDGEYIRISGDKVKPWQIVPNGTDGVLFESDHVKPIDAHDLRDELSKQFNSKEPLKCWWAEVLSEVRLKEKGEHATIAALLYYVTPWLNRWRGTQLPVELIVGEAGSGKSTLTEVRLNILTGDAKLRNVPEDLKSWNASIANSGGLHVTDNVHLMDKQLKQRMSDELCRLVTDPNPRIEMRKYYTEADLRTIHVGANFAFTAIQQPFMNADLLQRAFLLELDKSVEELKDGSFSFDSHWKEKQLSRFGGRTAWIAHHIRVLNTFLALVKVKWNPHYKSKHRLVNFEQALMLMAEVFGIKNDWIPAYLMYQNNSSVGRSDWVLEGLIQWAEDRRRIDKNWSVKSYSATDIANWAENQEDFEKNLTLINARSLGKWMQTNKHNMAVIVGMQEHKKVNNKMQYQLLPPPVMAEYNRGANPLLGDPKIN